MKQMSDNKNKDPNSKQMGVCSTTLLDKKHTYYSQLVITVFFEQEWKALKRQTQGDIGGPELVLNPVVNLQSRNLGVQPPEAIYKPFMNYQNLMFRAHLMNFIKGIIANTMYV